MTKKAWASVLFVIGLASFVGLFDTIVRFWAQLDLGIDIRQYETPHADQFMAQEPVFGSILLVGGLILWFMPLKPH